MFNITEESFPEREERVLKAWRVEDIFQKSLDERQGGKAFSFYDGPPFATGLPHYGHILAGTIKDVVPRYKTMKGFYVARRFGWDCHGLPVENEIEKGLELTGASSIEAFGIAKFNEECRKIVLRYTKEWEKTVERMGRWVDFKNTYRTMDKDFMESVWWVFGQLYEKGLVYEGFKVMPFSTKLGTPLSNFEANLNYKEVDDPSITVIFTLVEDPNTAILAWTTTPWTLPSNLALMVSSKLSYVKLKHLPTGKFFILAEGRVGNYFKNPEEIAIVDTFNGKELYGKSYQPLFPYFTPPKDPKAFRVIIEDEVGAEEGTGVVHSAPAFGEMDFFACAKEGIEPVCPVDHNGLFTAEVVDFVGQYVKDADKDIMRRLKGEGKIFHQGQIHHRYPFCWRSDTPLIYKTVSTWFIAVEKIKQKMLAANDQIYWVPEHLKAGRFGKWLENARDWAVSRNRYWGTPIPIWRSEDGELLVISSIQELEQKTGKSFEDIHRHYIDDVVIESHGKIFKKIPEVFDCWFESGSMPYAQDHFPFENAEKVKESFPADFIAEGLDQTRGWFYTLTVLSAALFDSPAFKNVIVNGIILAEDGTKMSKRLKNYPEPEIVINQYGADALRLYLLNSPAVEAEDLRFSEKGVELVLRQVLIPLWNAYNFLATYAEIYEWKPSENLVQHPPAAEIDRWLLSITQKLIQDVEFSMDRYELNKAVFPFVAFVEQLTNWYIRRSRSRFWSETASQDRDEAFATLYTALKTLVQVAAPFIPFLSDAIYMELRLRKDPLSVHLSDFPKCQENLCDSALEKEMALAQQVVSLGHGLRKDHKLKVRQPLSCAHLITSDITTLQALDKKQSLIMDELNVKKLCLHRDEGKFVKLVAKPNFRILGKKVGKMMNAVQKAIADLTPQELKKLQAGGLDLAVEGEVFHLTPEDVVVEREVLEGVIASSDGTITVALDTALSEELLEEGLAREIINKINTMRREQGFAVTDRVAVTIDSTPRVEKAFRKFEEFICHEVLAVEVSFMPCSGTEWDLNGESAKIAVKIL